MGMIEKVMSLIFGGGRNIVAETAEVFRENADKRAEREIALRDAALAQFGQEFTYPKQSAFNRFMDGLNRLPRPLMALGTIGLFISAMAEPQWFAERMRGIALVPEPLWWLLGAIISFYFGARHQAKTQQLQRDLASSLARTNSVLATLPPEDAPDSPDKAAAEPDAELVQEVARSGDNPALNDWRRSAATN